MKKLSSFDCVFDQFKVFSSSLFFCRSFGFGTQRVALLFSTHLNPFHRWFNTEPVKLRGVSICTCSAASARSDDVARSSETDPQRTELSH